MEALGSPHSRTNRLAQSRRNTIFPNDLRPYILIRHCGVCIANQQADVGSAVAVRQQVAVIDHGLALCFTLGLLPRYLSHFPRCTKNLATFCQPTKPLNPKTNTPWNRSCKNPYLCRFFLCLRLKTE
ncbi:MAG: hypothetical protein HQQ73_06185 [Desulfobulbaceae bacterium]|nr:hypothetical protein [Desulfobulbaceae bacterium]